jgi:hypothetical protein
MFEILLGYIVLFILMLAFFAMNYINSCDKCDGDCNQGRECPYRKGLNDKP